MSHADRLQAPDSDDFYNRARNVDSRRDRDAGRHAPAPKRHRSADRKLLVALLLYGRGVTTLEPWCGAANNLLNSIFMHEALLNPGLATTAPTSAWRGAAWKRQFM